MAVDIQEYHELVLPCQGHLARALNPHFLFIDKDLRRRSAVQTEVRRPDGLGPVFGRAFLRNWRGLAAVGHH